jgi:hypothetical protein
VVNTPHETLFHQALVRAHLSFETQSHPAGDRWEADIELRQKPIIIEVTNSPGETRRADRYRRKTEAFEAAGYRVYWFSNHQARTAADECVAKVMAENGLVPEPETVVLVRPNRIGHEGSLNPNWGGGPQLVACEQCGAEIKSYKRRDNSTGTARFCNQECYGKWLHEHPWEVKSKRVKRDWSNLAPLYAAGMSSIQLAEHYGVSKRKILLTMRELGIPIRPQGGPRIKGGLYKASKPDHDMVRTASDDKGAELGGTETA